MNYHRLYFMIVNRAARLQRTGLIEKHHVIPRCMGGANIHSPIVSMMPKEHFICHHLLTKMYPSNDKLKFAFWAMCNQKNGDAPRTYKVTSITYESAKKQFKIVNSRRHTGKHTSEHHREVSRKFLKEHNPHKPGKDSYLFGIPRTDAVKKKISDTKRRKHDTSNSHV